MNRLRKNVACGIVGLLLSGGCAGIDAGDLTEILSRGGESGDEGGGLGEGTIADALREALRVAIEKAVERTGQEDGFLANDAIRIQLPEQLESVGNALSKVGLGSQFEDLELAMNRAAESAAAEAAPVFVDAIANLSIADARGILDGGETAATDFLRSSTGDALRARFEPIVKERMSTVGLMQQYEQLMSSYRAIPFAPDVAFQPEGYVTDKALDGLFTVLGEEETRIRTDPAARATDLLQQVFGG